MDTCYPGGKNAEGVAQRIISEQPPHSVYVELFLGSGAVMRRKRPALVNNGVDLDRRVVAGAAASAAAGAWVLPGPRSSIVRYDDGVPEFRFECASALDVLLRPGWFGPGWLVYCDPPYLRSTRLGRRRLYRYELTEVEHARLLGLLAAAARRGCAVELSGYRSELYDRSLAGWRRVEYRGVLRGGRSAVECLWMSYPWPAELHDVRFVGRDYVERCRVWRRQRRWAGMLARMPVQERAAMLEALRSSRRTL